MDWKFLWQGLAIGFGIAAPVGPIGLLTIRRTLASGWTAGFVTGMGAATADAMYGAIAGFGLTAISGFLLSGQTALQLVGGGFLAWLGHRSFVAQPKRNENPGGAANLAAAYLSTVALTAANPSTILSFLAVFAGLGIAATGGDVAAAALLVLGVFLGSAAWWLILASVVTFLGKGLTDEAMRWINRGSGLLLAGFGAWSVAQALR